MMVNNFIYDIANTKSYGHIMVNVNDWHSDKILLQVNLKGKLLPTFITKVIKINPAPAYRPVPFAEGALVALSAIATRIGVMRPFQLPEDPNTYANVHISQVLGYFKEGEISIDNFVPLYDKVVMKKIALLILSAMAVLTTGCNNVHKHNYMLGRVGVYEEICQKISKQHIDDGPCDRTFVRHCLRKQRGIRS